MVKKRLSKGRGFGRYEEVVWGFNSDIVLRMVRGKPNYRASDDYAEGEARRYKKTMRDFMSLFGVFVLSDEIYTEMFLYVRSPTL